jgi:hypothetical protein
MLRREWWLSWITFGIEVARQSNGQDAIKVPGVPVLVAFKISEAECKRYLAECQMLGTNPDISMRRAIAVMAVCHAWTVLTRAVADTRLSGKMRPVGRLSHGRVPYRQRSGFSVPGGDKARCVFTEQPSHEGQLRR